MAKKKVDKSKWSNESNGDTKSKKWEVSRKVGDLKFDYFILHPWKKKKGKKEHSKHPKVQKVPEDNSKQSNKSTGVGAGLGN